MRNAVALTLTLALAACGAPPPPEPPAPPPVLGGAGIVATVEGGTLVVCPRDPAAPDGDALVPARLRELWIDAGNGPHAVPLTGWSTAEDGHLMADAQAEGHRFHVTVTLAEADSVRVDVVDEIGLPTPLRALGLTWSMALDGVDELDAPLAAADGRVADAAFRSPVLFARRGTDSVGLWPDLDVLDADRRLPQSLRFERTADGVALCHGVDAGSTVELRGERLHFAHSISVRSDAVPFATCAAIHDRLWREHAAWHLRHGAFPLEGATLDQLETGALQHAGLPTEPGVVHLDERQNILHDALALALLGRRRGDDALVARADLIVAFVLAAPRRAGLLPGACRFDPGRDQRDWLAGDPAGPAPDAYRAVDATASARLLLQLADLLPARRAAIESLCTNLSRFLIANQTADGRIPPLFESRYLRGEGLDGVDNGAETGGAAWFLAVWARHSGDQAAHAAARRAVSFLAIGPLATGAWPDLTRGRPEGSQVPVRVTVAIARALRAAAALAAGDSTDPATSLVEALGDELVALQWGWQPVWLSEPRIGAFAPSNLPDDTGGAATPMAAEALLAAYALGGRRELLQRASFALRRALLDTESSPDAGSALACAVAERIRNRFGQAVVDAVAGFGEGLDAVWIDRLVVDADRIRVRLMTRAQGLDTATVRFEHLPPDVPEFVVDGAGEAPIPRERLESGIELPVLTVPRIVFDPPTRIRAGAPWAPSARVEGDASGITAASLAIVPENAGPDAVPNRIPLVVDGDRLVARPLPTADREHPERRRFDTAGLVPGARLRTWIDVAGSDWHERTPADGPGREIRIGALDAIDVGDQDETPSAGADSPVVRFVDGRENARRVAPRQSVEYPLSIRSDALALEIRIRYAGRIEVTTADGQVLHDGTGDAASDGTPRDLELAIADPRRWREGRLTLRIAPAGDDPLLLARIEWLATGSAIAVPGVDSPSRPSGERFSRLSVCVVPVRLADLPETPARDSLEQAFFGGPEYRVTPAPQPHLTVGSAARWIEQLSGRLTTVEGVVTEPVASSVRAEDLRTGGTAALRTLLDELAPTIGPALAKLPGYPRIVFVVHGGRPLAVSAEPPRLLTDGRPSDAGGIPVVVQAERGDDGSYLSCGTITLALLERLYGILDLGTRANGNFGALALSSAGGGHLPVLPAGVNLERTGWASRVPVARIENRSQRVDIPSLMDGHAFLELDSDTLPDRGRLLLEFRNGGGDAPLAGLSIYRELDQCEALVLRRANGETVSPRLLRVSSQLPPASTPFAPASIDDLFRFESLLADGWSATVDASDVQSRSSTSNTHVSEIAHGRAPSALPPASWLASPQGESPWAVQDLELDAESPWLLHDLSPADDRPPALPQVTASPATEERPAAGIRIAWRGQDLLETPAGTWRLARPDADPVRIEVGDASAERGGRVTRDGNAKFAFELPPRRGEALRYEVQAGSQDAPSRLFGRIELAADSPGVAALRVFLDGRPVLETRLDPTERRDDAFVVDLPLSRSLPWVVVELTTIEPGLHGQLSRLVTVPLSDLAARVPIPSLPLTSGRTADGIARAGLRILRIGERGSARARVPVLLPAGHSMVRLHCGLPAGATHALRVSAKAVALDGSQHITLLDPTEIGGDGRKMLLALCELPPRDADEPALLDLELTGEPGDELWWIDVAVEKQ